MLGTGLAGKRYGTGTSLDLNSAQVGYSKGWGWRKGESRRRRATSADNTHTSAVDIN